MSFFILEIFFAYSLQNPVFGFPVAFSTVASLQLNDTPKLPGTTAATMRKRPSKKCSFLKISVENNQSFRFFYLPKSLIQQICQSFPEKARGKNGKKRGFSESIFFAAKKRFGNLVESEKLKWIISD